MHLMVNWFILLKGLNALNAAWLTADCDKVLNVC